MSAAVIYARISKDEAGESLGVDRQERLCRKLAKDRGLTVDQLIVDNDFSAYTTKKARPGFERLMEMLGAGEVSAVVVYHADRLYRRSTDLERLVAVVEGSGAQVHTVAAGDVDLSTASGRMVARMLGAAAQHESERMAERIRLKHDELASRGRPPGGRPPYGYRWGMEVDPATGTARRTYLPNPDEIEALRFMVARVLEGASLLGIARELDARGSRTREGRPWHSASVRASLVNPATVALRVHRREVAGPGDWQPILERDEWEAVQATLKDPARARRRPSSLYLVSGLVVTPDGDRMNGHLDRYKRRTYATRYEAARSVTIAADPLEDFIIEAVLQVLDAAVLPPVVPTVGGADVAGIEQELADLAALRGEGTISLAEWLAARDPLQARLDAARRTVPPSSKAARLLARPGAVRKAWPDLDATARRAVLEAVVDRIIVGPTTRGRWATIEERLDPSAGWGVVWKC